MNAVRRQLSTVALRRRVQPHARVHGRRDQHGFVGRHEHGAGQIIGMAAGHLRHQIGGGRGHHDQIGLAREADVADLALVIEVEKIGEDPVVGQGTDRQRCDELLRCSRHDCTHRYSAFPCAPDQLQAFVGGDAAADDQQ